MFLDLIRRLVPIKYRQNLGLWVAHQAGRTKLFLYPFMLLLCKTVPKNLKLLPNDDCIIEYKSHRIFMPRDGIFTSWEVLQDEIYERIYRFNKGDTVVDIGAYVGMFTVKAALEVGEKGKVIAIEPSSQNLSYLSENTVLLPNVKVISMAAGSSKRFGSLTITEASPCHTILYKENSYTERVEVDTLDNILQTRNIDKVDFIKIDAEGSELDILQGATKTLLNNKLKLAIAAYHNLPNGVYELPHLKKYLVDMGFKVTIIKEYIYADNLGVK